MPDVIIQGHSMTRECSAGPRALSERKPWCMHVEVAHVSPVMPV